MNHNQQSLLVLFVLALGVSHYGYGAGGAGGGGAASDVDSDGFVVVTSGAVCAAMAGPNTDPLSSDDSCYRSSAGAREGVDTVSVASDDSFARSIVRSRSVGGAGTASAVSVGSFARSVISDDILASSVTGVVDARVAIADSLAEALAASGARGDLDADIGDLERGSVERFADKAVLVALADSIERATAQRTTAVDEQLADIGQRVAAMEKAAAGYASRAYVDEQLAGVVPKPDFEFYFDKVGKTFCGIDQQFKDFVRAREERAAHVDQQLKGFVTHRDTRGLVAQCGRRIDQLALDMHGVVRKDYVKKRLAPWQQKIEELEEWAYAMDEVAAGHASREYVDEQFVPKDEMQQWRESVEHRRDQDIRYIRALERDMDEVLERQHHQEAAIKVLAQMAWGVNATKFEQCAVEEKGTRWPIGHSMIERLA